MAFFVFPQAWIAPAIAAATVAFGPVEDQHGEHVSPIKIQYRHLPGQSLGAARPPDKILIDKKRRSEWPKEKAQCVIVHEYGHLAGRGHSSNPRSIMYRTLRYRPCHRWLVKHGVD
jgi:hypothetical protein